MSTAMAETNADIATITLNNTAALHAIAMRRFLRWIIFLACLFCLFPLDSHSVSASGIEITAARIGSIEHATRITLESRKPIQHELSILNNPGRVVVDLIDIPLNDAIKSLPEKINPVDPFIERIRYGRFKPHVIRVVLDLKANVVSRTSVIGPRDGHGYQLILDIYRPDKAAVAENNPEHHQKAPPIARKTISETDALDHLVATLINAQPASARPPLAPKPSQQQAGHSPQIQQAQQAQQLHQPQQAQQPPSAAASRTTVQNYPESHAAARLRKPVQTKAQAQAQAQTQVQTQARTRIPAAKRVITIAIDPGHGGHDPGAIAKNGKGTKEKDITLAISKKLKAIIDKAPNMQAILTRTGDYSLDLHQRQAIARKHKADLFVSIHADGSEKVHPSGSSVYTLSEHGATSTTAGWIAKQANQSGNHLVGGVDIASKSGDMREIILDLSMSATINDSVRVAEFVLREISQINRLHKKTVEQAGFVVLKSPDIPSILVETAFITNPHEEKKLIDKTYQDKMANAIFAGIRNYFATNPALARTEMARVR